MKNASDFPDLFWDDIDKAEGQNDKLAKRLAEQPKVLIVLFENDFERARQNLYEIEVPGFSEDALKDLYAEVVSQGKEYYQYIVDNPDRILENEGSEVPCFQGIAYEVFFEKYGYELFEHPRFWGNL